MRLRAPAVRRYHQGLLSLPTSPDERQSDQRPADDGGPPDLLPGSLRSVMTNRRRNFSARSALVVEHLPDLPTHLSITRKMDSSGGSRTKRTAAKVADDRRSGGMWNTGRVRWTMSHDSR